MDHTFKKALEAISSNTFPIYIFSNITCSYIRTDYTGLDALSDKAS